MAISNHAHMDSPPSSPTRWKSESLWGILLTFFGAIFFSAKAILVKVSYDFEVSAVSLLTLRMVFALPFFLLIAGIQRFGFEHQRLSFRHWAMLSLMGFLGFYCASLMDYIGLQYITASLERLILYVYPTLVVLLSALIYKRPVNAPQGVALVLTYAGVYLAFYQTLHVDGDPAILTGGLWVFGAALAYALYLIGSGDLIPKMGAIRYNALSMSVASTGIITHYLFWGDGQIFSLEKEVYGLGLATAIFSTLIPTFMISRGIGLIGASNAAIVGSVGPISTIVLASIFLKEHISVLQWTGTGMVLLGVLWISLGMKRNA